MAAPTRNPIQPKPTSLPGDAKHYGPGFRRTAGSLVGPAVKIPRINESAQSGPSKAADNGAYATDGSPLGDNPRQISRDGLTPGNLDNYGAGD